MAIDAIFDTHDMPFLTSTKPMLAKHGKG